MKYEMNVAIFLWQQLALLETMSKTCPDVCSLKSGVGKKHLLCLINMLKYVFSNFCQVEDILDDLMAEISVHLKMTLFKHFLG